MALTPEALDRLALLARLELAPADRDRLGAQVNDFFALVEQMQAVDTTGVQPLAHPVAVLQDVALRLADDIADAAVQGTERRDAYLRNAPAAENGLFLVPKVIE